ncbi:OmpA family protein [Vibrio sp. SM6]|uniref:OmpA family protein n=2 Tax=Vibrio agarilyticus TaxID=2726741 RepID=A0A7X8YHG4_9VIBR|nr:OmpA family protein [Vibrio agarilyticus]NLS13704.1 OmpA family protein [Vibrio agarilyticus]
MDLSHWSSESNKFFCELKSEFSGGKFFFRAEPGNKLMATLEYKNNEIAYQSAGIYIQSPPWNNHFQETFVASHHRMSRQSMLFQNDIERLLNAMAQGQWLNIQAHAGEVNPRHSVKNANVSGRFELPIIRINAPLEAFKQCRNALPGMNYQDARTVTLGFAIGQTQLSSAQRATLRDFLSYLVLDDAVTHVLIDGHTDSYGPKLVNLKVSRDRAQQVSDYLQTQGLNAKKIQVRAHGERYPLVSNNSAEGRNKNRRVVVRLVRRDEAISIKESVPPTIGPQIQATAVVE